MHPQHKYPALLALVSVCILGAGMLLKPKEPRHQEPVLSQTEMARLQRLAQRRSLEDMNAYFGSLAKEAGTSVVRLKERAESGIVWDARTVVVADSPKVASSDFSIVALRAGNEAGLQPARKSDVKRVESGSWVVLVARGPDGKRRFVPGVYSGTSPAACGGFPYREVETSVPLTAAMLGGGLFDMQSRLLAVVVRCGNRFTAMPVADVDAVLDRAAKPAELFLVRYGMRLSALTDASRAYFRAANGLLVDEVREDSAAAAAGLTPGDVITAVSGQPPGSIPELEAMLERHAEEARIEVIRGGRKRALAWAPDPAAGSLASAGLVLASPSRGYAIEHVLPDSPAFRAGIRPGDRLLRIDGRAPAGIASVRRLLGGETFRSCYVVVRRGNSALGLFLK